MDRIIKWLQKVSIPAAFIICGVSCLLAAILLTKATVWFSQKNRNEIEGEYVKFISLDDLAVATGDNATKEEQLWGTVTAPEDATVNFVAGDELGFQIVGDDEGQYPKYAEVTELNGELFATKVVLPEEVKKQYDFYVGLDEIAAVLWYSVCLCLAALVFYVWKIKKPFHVLNQAVQKISANDLDFHIEYDGQDEFGSLCHAFEIMRQELEQNSRKMWNTIEERKRLNAAFAHDLRTPLTVMRGHTDMLLSAITDDTDPSGEMAGSIQAISNQIARLGAFADTMGSLQRLEDYEPCLEPMSSSALMDMVSQTANALYPNGQVEIHSELEEQNLLLDKEAVAQICENILSNAVRYVKEVITISVKQEQECLIISIEDDGIGFTKKDLANASLAYYRGEKARADAASHFGLGLYISSILAEKLGGSLQLGNRVNGGARAQIKICCI